MDHKSAQALITTVYTAMHGRAPTVRERHTIGAVSAHETYYGQAAPFGGTFNMGAVQLSKPGPDGMCPVGSFLHKDSYPTSDRGNISYAVCFRTYPDETAGMRHLVKLLTLDRPNVWKVLDSGDATEIARQMYRSHYFGGFGKTEDERIAGYAKALDRRGAQIGQATGEGQQVRIVPGGTGAAPGASSSSGGGWLLAAGVGVLLFWAVKS